MLAEVISIGSEITSGQNLDTNCRWLSQRLAEIGIETRYHTTVADDLDANIDVFARAMQRADVVLTTGGLGPTLDDLTREVIARVIGVELYEDADSVVRISEMFSRRGRVMPERNRVQAMFPVGSEALLNRAGTAPGVWLALDGKALAAMPGVPSEMFVMYREQVVPRLLAMGIGGGVMIQRKINTFGWGESQIEEKLSDITRRGHVPEVGITASDATISLRIFARGATAAEALAQAAPVEATIRDRLGTLVFGSDDEDLASVVVRMLRAERKTISVAEGVTGGYVGRMLVGVPGASEVFRGGIIAYDDATKERMLGISRETIAEYGNVSPEVARAMAVACRLKFGTDLAVATVGIAGPDGGSDDRPVGLVWGAVAWAEGSKTHSSSWIASRAEIQSRTAKMVLNLARLRLMGEG